MMTIRSRSASFSGSCRNLRNSAKLVCATIASSTWISGKRDTLTFFSCVSGSSRYRNSRFTLRISIIKVKREFLYLLLTLTQEKNVKVSRFPLIHVDEGIVAHTNFAEFRKFLQEPENEPLLDRMVIIQVPYTLDYKEEARIYRKLCSSTQAFREVHLDPHALHVAAVFAVLSRLTEGEEREADNVKKLRLYGGEDVEGMAPSEAAKIRA